MDKLSSKLKKKKCLLQAVSNWPTYNFSPQNRTQQNETSWKLVVLKFALVECHKGMPTISSKLHTLSRGLFKRKLHGELFDLEIIAQFISEEEEQYFWKCLTLLYFFKSFIFHICIVYINPVNEVTSFLFNN